MACTHRPAGSSLSSPYAQNLTKMTRLRWLSTVSMSTSTKNSVSSELLHCNHLSVDLALVHLPESTFSYEIGLVEVASCHKHILEGEAVRVAADHIRRDLPPRISP